MARDESLLPFSFADEGVFALLFVLLQKNDPIGVGNKDVCLSLS
jgi:hypothetical protein